MLLTSETPFVYPIYLKMGQTKISAKYWGEQLSLSPLGSTGPGASGVALLTFGPDFVAAASKVRIPIISSGGGQEQEDHPSNQMSQWKISFSNNSCMFLNPYDFFQFEFELFQFVIFEKPPGTG